MNDYQGPHNGLRVFGTQNKLAQEYGPNELKQRRVSQLGT